MKRGFKIRGGELDVEKGAHSFLQDYRTGAIGRISLETPESRKEMMESSMPEEPEPEKE